MFAQLERKVVAKSLYYGKIMIFNLSCSALNLVEWLSTYNTPAYYNTIMGPRFEAIQFLHLSQKNVFDFFFKDCF